MEKNNIIGITLIFLLFFAWSYVNTPSKEEIERQKFLRDSIQMAQQAEEAKQLANTEIKNQEPNPTTPPTTQTEVPDSIKEIQLNNQFGDFAPYASGTESFHTIENDLFKVTFTNKGGRIKEVELKRYNKLIDNDKGEEIPTVLKLLEDDNNRFEYLLPLHNGHTISTQDLYFLPQLNGNTITFRIQTPTGGYFDQKYTVSTDNYNLDYTIAHDGLGNSLQTDDDLVRLNWVTFLDKLEKNVYYERLYSTVYFKETDDDPSYCSCRGDDEEKLKNRVKWISQSNQFFNASLIADQSFASAEVATVMLDDDDKNLKRLNSAIMVPFGDGTDNQFNMQWFIGPNEFTRLAAYDNRLEDIIPYGWSIFGTINRWVIRPLFNFLSGFIGSKGIVILVLTLLVKLALYPLTYKMLYSQSKMGALKPQLASMKEKFGDDAQKQQMETMKMYREFGVNPLGGCFPIVLQMPIWFALYRFFPASIEFRQASFLWATDLSSYDVFFKLPFELPLNMGAHISMFTLLWAVTTLIYTFYNTRHMDMSINPAMKYMQYLMPVMFMGFFNSYASGLTCYLFFSNIFNIGQTVVTKNYIIDKEKIKAELEAYRKKPKKKGGFQQRLEAALKEQQRVAAEQQKQKGKKKKGNKK